MGDWRNWHVPTYEDGPEKPVPMPPEKKEEQEDKQAGNSKLGEMLSSAGSYGTGGSGVNLSSTGLLSREGKMIRKQFMGINEALIFMGHDAINRTDARYFHMMVLNKISPSPPRPGRTGRSACATSLPRSRSWARSRRF